MTPYKADGMFFLFNFTSPLNCKNYRFSHTIKPVCICSLFVYSIIFRTWSCSEGFGLYMKVVLMKLSNDIPGTIENEKFWIKVATTVLISIKANLYPTHIRGPVENGRKAKRLLGLFCLSKKVKVSYIIYCKNPG